MYDAKAKGGGECSAIVVTTADGRKFNLGKPSSRLFALRRALYLWRRRKEL
jgi:hypothetical protein